MKKKFLYRLVLTSLDNATLSVGKAEYDGSLYIYEQVVSFSYEFFRPQMN